MKKLRITIGTGCGLRKDSTPISGFDRAQMTMLTKSFLLSNCGGYTITTADGAICARHVRAGLRDADRRRSKYPNDMKNRKAVDDAVAIAIVASVLGIVAGVFLILLSHI
jgi:hypothetical protein